MRLSCIFNFIVVIFLALNCDPNTSSKNVKIEVRELYRIGSSTADTLNSLLNTVNDGFGLISSLAVDFSGNLYVLDGSFMELKKYDSVGKLSLKISLKKGKGPGEFMSPREIAIDKNGHLFLTDFTTRRVTVLDVHGHFLRDFPLQFMPAKIAVCDSNVFVTGVWLSYDGPIVHRFSLEGNFLGASVERPPKWRLISMSGNFDRLVVTWQRTIIYSFPQPYQILELDCSGKIIRTSTDLPKFEDPEPSQGGSVVMKEGSRGLAVLPSGHILNIVQSGTDWRIDVLSPNLDIVGVIQANQFGLSAFRYIATDSQWNAYLDVADPLPHIIKYKLDMLVDY
jgi:hypothetical protein